MLKTLVIVFGLWASAYCSRVETLFKTHEEIIDHALLKGNIPQLMRDMDANIYRFFSNEFGDFKSVHGPQINNSDPTESSNHQFIILSDLIYFSLFQMII